MKVTLGIRHLPNLGGGAGLEEFTQSREKGRQEVAETEAERSNCQYIHTVMVPLDFNNQPHMGTSGLAPCFASTQPLLSCNTSAVPSCYSSSPHKEAPSWPFCQPLLILHLEFMPSFTCKWGPGKEQLHPTLESLVSPALQWPLHQKQATSHQRFLFRPTYCRNERGKTLGKVFHCLFLCLQPVSESNLDLLQRQGADYWSAPSHPTHCHGQIQPTAVIPTPTQPFQVSTKTNGMLPTTSSPSSCPCVQELGWRLSWFNKLKFMDPWLG